MALLAQRWMYVIGPGADSYIYVVVPFHQLTGPAGMGCRRRWLGLGAGGAGIKGPFRPRKCHRVIGAT
jgi:hypothetical protein